MDDFEKHWREQMVELSKNPLSGGKPFNMRWGPDRAMFESAVMRATKLIKLHNLRSLVAAFAGTPQYTGKTRVQCVKALVSAWDRSR